MKKIRTFWKVYIKTDKKIINYGNAEVEKHKFNQNKIPIPISNINTNKIVVSNKVSCVKKRF